MKGFYDILITLKNHFDNDPLVNTVTQGDIFQVDLSKQTIFPLVHLIVNSSTLQESTMKFNISIIAMDIVDISKDEVTDLFQENNNELDVLNTQHHVLNRAYEILKHGNLWDNKYEIDGEPTLEPFTERFENYLAGWTMTLDLMIPNEMSVCDNENIIPFCSPAYVVNSDNSYSETIASGSTFSLPDTTFNVLIDGVQTQSTTYPTLSTQTIEITWQ